MSVNCSCPFPREDCPSFCEIDCEACNFCGNPVKEGKALRDRLKHAEAVLADIGKTEWRRIHHYKGEPTYGRSVDKKGFFQKSFCVQCGYSTNRHAPSSSCPGHKARTYLVTTAEAVLAELMRLFGSE